MRDILINTELFSTPNPTFHVATKYYVGSGGAEKLLVLRMVAFFSSPGDSSGQSSQSSFSTACSCKFVFFKLKYTNCTKVSDRALDSNKTF